MLKSTSTSLILLGILAVVVGIFAIAWPGVTILALVILIYGFSQITAGIQVRHLGGDVKSLSDLSHAA
jgi:uncharacterized membrane protein HdeD (DUF308 family)